MKLSKKGIAVFVAVVSAAALSAAILTGCSKDKDDNKTTASEASSVTVASSVKEASSTAAEKTEDTEQQTEENTQAATESAPQEGETAAGEDATEADDGYIDEGTAYSNVKKQAGSGATIISSYKGFAPDGTKAWVITVSPITSTAEEKTVTYYCGDQFCYPESDTSEPVAEEDDGYIDSGTAVANVKQQAGSGATILSSYKGFAPDGTKAWVITVAPITNGEGPDTVTYYSGYQFCYPDTSITPADDSDTQTDDDYIDRADAVANVKQQAGSGAAIISVEKGTAPDGAKAWVITVSPITNGETPDTVTYYCGNGFCYAG